MKLTHANAIKRFKQYRAENWRLKQKVRRLETELERIKSEKTNLLKEDTCQNQ